MEQALATVIASLNDPALSSLVSGMASPPPSPRMPNTNQLTTSCVSSLSSNTSLPSEGPSDESKTLPYLPMDTLNPLGLLAETSLHHKRAITLPDSTSQGKDEEEVPQVLRYIARHPTPNAAHPIDYEAALRDAPNLGVANESYFKPGA
jgi:hypothetical protein